MVPFHARPAAEVIDALGSGQRGLSSEEAAKRLTERGANALPPAPEEGVLHIFIRQFKSPLIYILLGAAVLVLLMGDIVDALIIMAVLAFNAVVGTFQEGRAHNALKALRTMVETNATVMRDGQEIIISDTDVVPGDILILQEGERVAADARIITTNALKAGEASLTGESNPVHKTLEVAPEGAPPMEQRNMVFKGTNIVTGSGTAIVVATGGETAIGKIAEEITGIDTDTPLKTNIRQLSRLILGVTAVVCVMIFTFGVLSGNSVREMFTTVVAVAVSVIPEGLPVVMTLVLATGVWRMGKKHVLVKRLQAVEALGHARVIAVDKTGTITKNEMVVQAVVVGDDSFSVGGVGYAPEGDVRLATEPVDAANHPALLLMGKIAAYSASARVMYSKDVDEWRVAGDPTEAALLVLGQKLGFHKDQLEGESPLLAEMPFDYHLKYRATVHAEEGRRALAMIGAPEEVLERSGHIWKGGKSVLMTPEDRARIEAAYIELSEAGLRVIGAAIERDLAEGAKLEALTELTFVGFFGMKDALRQEVAPAMDAAREAGMRVVMITGDHRVTAEAIACEAGIRTEGTHSLTGTEIDAMTDKELALALAATSVFARVTPEHKLRIVNAYRARGETIAMTGDGVNDAPSLVAADLGVAMGKVGTDVAKEASDIVLLDDNFGSIVSAVEEGRSIYRTMRKVILYMFSTSLGEVLAIGGALAVGFPLPILPAQIIWLNFVTDGFLTVALAMEPHDKGLLRGRFNKPNTYLIDLAMGFRMILMAIPMAIGSLYLFSLFFEMDIVKAWTITLTALAVFQWFNAWNCRSATESVFAANPLKNLWLVGATALVIVLQLVAVYTPLMQRILHTSALSFAEWIAILMIGLSIIFVEEIRKVGYRWYLRLGTRQAE
jgi:Ca2+-transporting ATPase